tara:strand:- start:50 stop:526 length:477 start_codon:yes stop_codon:yes gene_type:complete
VAVVGRAYAGATVRRKARALGVFLMNAEILKNKLIDSSLLEAEAALELLRNGAELMVDDTIIDVASSGILDTYKIRARHISKRDGVHAQRLAKTALEFVKAIEFRDPKELKTASVISPDLGRFLIWFEPLSGELIGCCYLIKNSEVTEETWNQIWDNT